MPVVPVVAPPVARQPTSELATRPIPIHLPIPPPGTPQPRPRSGRRLALVLLVPILGGLSALALVRLPQPAAKTSPAASRVATASRRGVAILGFKNLSGDPRQDWISSALTEILGFELAAPGRVRLMPAESVARMRRELAVPDAESHTAPRLAAIGRNLGTDLVVAGSYLLAAEGPERLRIQVVVQDVHTGETVAWARETGSPDALVDLATAVARSLQETIGGPGTGSVPEAAAFAANGESLRLYSEALAKLRVWDAPAALPLLERAAALDPKSPFPQDSLAAAYSRLGFDGQAQKAAQSALDLSRKLPREIRLGLEGRSREVRGEWAEAVAIYRAQQRLHPDDLEVGLRLAAVQTSAGQADHALATVASLRALPPPAGADPRLDLAEAEAAWRRGDFARTRDAATRAIAGAERRSAALLAAHGRLTRGWACFRLGQGAAALTDAQAARDLYLKMGDRGAAAGALVAAASFLQATGRPADARQAYTTALAVLREIGDRGREAKTLNNYAALLGDEGDYAGVTTLLERSLAIKREIRDLHGTAVTLANLGNLLRTRGDLRGARARLEEALAINRQTGEDFGVAFDLRGLARVLVHERRTGEALAALEEALGLSRKTGDAEGAAEALLALGDLCRQAERHEQARDWYRQAYGEFQALRQTGNMVYPLLNLAEMDGQQNHLDEALAGFDRALTLARQASNGLLEAHARSGLAETAEKRGDLKRARDEHEKALALWTRLGRSAEATRSRQALARLALASTS